MFEVDSEKILNVFEYYSYIYKFLASEIITDNMSLCASYSLRMVINDIFHLSRLTLSSDVQWLSIASVENRRALGRKTGELAYVKAFLKNLQVNHKKLALE